MSRVTGGILLALALISTPALGAETVILGSVGSSSANGWPSYVAIEKGFFAAEDIKPDAVFAQSNAAVIQQLAAGSVNVSTNSGLVDPIRAIEKGAPLAIIRIEVQKPPYTLLAKASIKILRARCFRSVERKTSRVFLSNGCWNPMASNPANST